MIRDSVFLHYVRKKEAVCFSFEFILWQRKKAVGRVKVRSQSNNETNVELASSMGSLEFSYSSVPRLSLLPSPDCFSPGFTLSSCLINWLLLVAWEENVHWSLGRAHSGV